MTGVKRRLNRAAAEIGKRVLNGTIYSNGAARDATLQTLDELHTAHVDIHMGEVSGAVRKWLNRWPWRRRRATALDTGASRFFLGV